MMNTLIILLPAGKETKRANCTCWEKWLADLITVKFNTASHYSFLLGLEGREFYEWRKNTN